MPKMIYVLNGPNLNLLGKRQPEVYGLETLADVEQLCRRVGTELGLSIFFRQSNREYEIIEWIHQARDAAKGIIINPASFSHTSIAILDALYAYDGPMLEVHISNVHNREKFRRHSYSTEAVSGVIAGCGIQGYELALRRMAFLLHSGLRTN